MADDKKTTTKAPAKTKAAAPKTAVAPKQAAAAKAAPAKAAAKPATKPAAEKKVAAKAAPRGRKPTGKPTIVAPEQRRQLVQVAAYFIAERRGFGSGREVEDWLEAEAEVERMLSEGLISP